MLFFWVYFVVLIFLLFSLALPQAPLIRFFHSLCSVLPLADQHTNSLSKAKEESKQIELAKKGGIDVILEVIRKHQMDPETQALACGAIRALAVAQTNKLSVAMKGGVQTLTTSLRINLPHIHVFRQVVAALWNLALHSDLQLRIGKVGTIVNRFS